MTKLANCIFDFVLPVCAAMVLGYWLMHLAQHQSIIVLDANGNTVTCLAVELKR